MDSKQEVTKHFCSHLVSIAISADFGDEVEDISEILISTGLLRSRHATLSSTTNFATLLSSEIISLIELCHRFLRRLKLQLYLTTGSLQLNQLNYQRPKPKM